MSAGAISEGFGVIGSLLTSALNSAAETAQRQNLRLELDKYQQQAQKMLDEYEKNQKSFSSDGDLEKYQQLKDNYNADDYVYDFDEFDTSKYDVNNYLNEDKDSILADIAKASQATAAGSALGHSAGAKAIADKAIASKSEELLNNAYERMNSERTFDYQQYNDYIQNMQNKLNTQNQNYQTQMNNLKSDLQFDQQQAQDNLNNRLSLGNTVAQSKASLV